MPPRSVINANMNVQYVHNDNSAVKTVADMYGVCEAEVKAWVDSLKR